MTSPTATTSEAIHGADLRDMEPHASLRAMTELAVELRHGDWEQCDTTGWPDNDTCDQLLTWSWTAGTTRSLVVVNDANNPATAMVRLPWTDLAGRTWQLDDLLNGDRYERDGDDVATSGLYVSLPPRGSTSSGVHRPNPPLSCTDPIRRHHVAALRSAGSSAPCPVASILRRRDGVAPGIDGTRSAPWARCCRDGLDAVGPTRASPVTATACGSERRVKRDGGEDAYLAHALPTLGARAKGADRNTLTIEPSEALACADLGTFHVEPVDD